MADKPNYGNNDYVTTLMTAQLVELMVASAESGTSANDKLTTMRGVSISEDHSRRRINHGLRRQYFHSAPDILMTFTISGESDLLEYIRTRGVRNGRGVLPRYVWSIKATPETGSAKTLTVTAQLENATYTKPTESQDDPFDITCSLIVSNIELPSWS